MYGRVAGDTAAAYLLQNVQSASDKAAGRLAAVAGHLLETKIVVDPQGSKVNLEFSWKGDSSSGQQAAYLSGPNETSARTPSTISATEEKSSAEPPKPKAEEKGEAKKTGGEYTMEEVAKHNTQNDCWVVVNGEVLDVTKVIISSL